MMPSKSAPSCWSPASRSSRPHRSPARWKAGSIRAGCRRAASRCSPSGSVAARSRAGSPISTRCSGRRSCVASAIMFCLLPPTRLALGALTASQVPDASGLFNLMRNLGGAIGIALIDTILYGRTAQHAGALRDRLIAGDITAAQAIGLDLQLFTHRPRRRVGRRCRSLCSAHGRAGGVCDSAPTKPGPCWQPWRCSD